MFSDRKRTREKYFKNKTKNVTRVMQLKKKTKKNKFCCTCNSEICCIEIEKKKN